MTEKTTNPITRRNFLWTSGAALGSWCALSSVPRAGAAESWPPREHSLIRKGDVILFQGDSITDAGRSREKAGNPNEQAALGNGYAWLASAELLVERPKAGLKFFNRGISGNKVYQLADRWQADCLDLRPNVLSILIGVNDFWHTLNGSYHGTVEIYERDYRALLERTRKVLPRTRLVICEPFVLRTGVVNDKWFPVFDEYRAAARRVAEAFRAVFIPYQAMFDQAIKYALPSQFTADGVHPSPSGASLMAEAWIRTAASD